MGDKGKLLADYGRKTLFPKGDAPASEPPAPSIPKSIGHHREWIHGCKTGAPTLCNFNYSGRLIENNLLGTVAHRVGKKLQWDHKQLKATNAAEADRYIHKTYRDGWAI